MLSIIKLNTENVSADCITDNPNPRFSFALDSDRQATELNKAVVSVREIGKDSDCWRAEVRQQIAVRYDGQPLRPFTRYTVTAEAEDNHGETARASSGFRTGRLNTPWEAVFITDTSYKFRGKKVSPEVMTFRKDFDVKRQIRSAWLYSTALGIYEAEMNGKKIGNDYFAPGFTSYRNQMQYQSYDVTDMLKDKNVLTFEVAGGWAVGKFTHSLRNRVFARRQALLAELRIEYADGTTEIIGTNDSWDVAVGGRYKLADFYDGETFDCNVGTLALKYKKAGKEKLGFKPEILATYGALTRAHEEMKPVAVTVSPSGAVIYDFGQNFAGVIKAVIKGRSGQKATFRHAEILMDGELFTKPLRTAKATATCICGDGVTVYSPKFTFMGFRYVSLEGVQQSDVELFAYALYSDIPDCGSFSCSHESLNKLQSNLRWSTKSNFIDIPTDCPQRDERMGWTGDIALFSRTAAYNFDTSRFFEKWLKDLRSDQKRTGGIPVTIPHVVFPSNFESIFVMAIDHWGDSSILVPWSEYLARGDVNVLREGYACMKKYVKACLFWAGLGAAGKYRRIWKWGHHYGDWCAPGIGLWGWMRRGKWTATAALGHSTRLMSEIAGLLGETADSAYYKKLSEQTSEAYRKVFTDGKGKLKKEFQTAYVLPLYYGMFPEGEEKRAAAENLVKLIRGNDYKIATGFPGTPYVLFALADNGYSEDAYKMLLNDSCPSWMHQIKAGGTTVWERWDALREDGTSNTGATDGTNGMVSFNHYANGAVGDFLYRRIAGIEAVSGGYREFRIRPVTGGGLTYAKANVVTPYGEAESAWDIKDGVFNINVKIPVGTTCELTLPDGKSETLKSGAYKFSCAV